VGLLAFSPIGAGILSGKYNGDRIPEGSRRSGSENIGGRITQHLWPFMEEYVGVAGRFHMDPSQLALAWSLTRPGMTSAIFGATRMDQLETAIGAVDLEIPDEVLNALSDIHRRHPMPI
jgi:aryl-alcohol dehydrogenase-like predicted oxidoreductase